MTFDGKPYCPSFRRLTRLSSYNLSLLKIW
jgi:hypothetical protein